MRPLSRIHISTALIALTACFIFGTTLAQSAGELDPAFAQNGIQVIEWTEWINPSDLIYLEAQNGMAPHIILGGTTRQDMFLAYFTTDGVLDTTYGDSGFVYLGDHEKSETATKMLKLPDNRVLICGYSINGNTGALAMAHADGTPDTTFGPFNGLRIIDPSAEYFGEFFGAMALNPDNKSLIAAGYCYGTTANTVDLFLCKIFLSGQIDSSFAESGFLHIPTTDYHTTIPAQSELSSVKILKNGNIMAAGGEKDSMIVVCVDSMGQPVSGFGKEGISKIRYGGAYPYINDMICDLPDGETILAGRYIKGGMRPLLTTIDATGHLSSDTLGFHKTTVRLASEGDNVFLESLVPLRNAGNDLTGFIIGMCNLDFGVALCTPDGRLDPLFGNEGFVFTDISGESDYLSNIIVDPQDGILATGRGPWSFGLVRYVGNFSTGISESIPSRPETFSLDPNFPNPFNPETTIHYSLTGGGHTGVFVIDLLGRKVRTLVNDSRPAGNYSIQWDGRTDSGIEAASGTYLVILKTGQKIRAQKAVLIR